MSTKKLFYDEFDTTLLIAFWSAMSGVVLFFSRIAQDTADAKSATYLVVVSLLFSFSVFSTIIMRRNKKFDTVRKQKSYDTWEYFNKHDLLDQILKVVGDYVDDKKYYRAQMKKLYNVIKTSVILGANSGYSVTAIQNMTNSLIEKAEELKKFDPIKLPDAPVRHCIEVTVFEDAFFLINQIGGIFEYPD